MSHDISHVIARIKESPDVFEKARLMKFLKDEHEIRIVELAQALEMKPSYIAHYLRLNKLPVILMDGYYAQLVSTSHLFIISRLPDYETMIRVYEEVLAKNLTSQQTEEVVREVLYETKTEGDRLKVPEVTQMVREITHALGDVDVKIIQSRIRSKISIEIKGSLEHSTRILRRIARKITSEPAS